MGDTNGIIISDVLGLSQPITKLVETVSSGIGKIYEPWHIKRMAKAKGQEIDVICKAIDNNIELPVTFTDGEVSIDSQDFNELLSRARQRFLFQELTKQQNIEAVIANARDKLMYEEYVSDEPVDKDWINEFFNYIANVSTEQMQVLWGKLLAGEIKHPGSFSLRTLDTLRKLTQHEASTFKEVMPYILKCKGYAGISFDYFIMDGSSGFMEKKYNTPFTKIMLLSECGLLSNNGQISIDIQIEPYEGEEIQSFGKTIKILNSNKNAVEIIHPAYFLTETGKELLPIITDVASSSPDDYLQDCIDELINNGNIYSSSIKDNIRFTIC